MYALNCYSAIFVCMPDVMLILIMPRICICCSIEKTTPRRRGGGLAHAWGLLGNHNYFVEQQFYRLAIPGIWMSRKINNCDGQT